MKGTVKVSKKKLIELLGMDKYKELMAHKVEVKIGKAVILRIKKELSMGNLVCLRPVNSNPGRFEFVNPKAVHIDARRHFEKVGAASKTHALRKPKNLDEAFAGAHP